MINGSSDTKAAMTAITVIQKGILPAPDTATQWKTSVDAEHGSA
jgi:hypothetical protein